MGYNLHPNNLDAGEHYMGSFFWSWLLDAGVGLAINCGPALKPWRYYYKYDASGGAKAPKENDGYEVSDEDAKLMGRLAESIVWLERERRKEFNEMPKERQTECEKLPSPVRDDFVDKAEKFAEWAPKSGGFSIH